MECRQARAPLAAYVDGELTDQERVRIEAHVRACPRCQRLRQVQWFASDQVRREATRHASPAGLERRLQRLVAGEAPRSPMPRLPRIPRLPRLRWPAFAVAMPAAGAAFAAATVVAGAMMIARPAQETQLAGDAFASHVRSMLAASAIDVASSDQHTVKPWFAGRLDYSPPVADFSSEGFTLLGARRDYVGGRTVAALVYQCRRHVVDVFVWPDASPPSAPRWLAPRQGYHLLHWSQDGMAYWAVTDLETHDLERLQRLLASPSKEP